MLSRAKFLRWSWPLAAWLWASPGVNAKTKAMLVNDNIEAAAIRRDLARSATQSIYASMYMLKPDRVGMNTLLELADAARRGVDVHFMVDGLYTKKFPREVIEYVLASGVKLYEYNPFDIHEPKKYLERSHDKVWVVDDEWVDISDRNVANEYHGLTRTPAVSRGMIVRDAVTAGDAKKYMIESFAHPRVKKMVAIGDAELLEKGRQLVEKTRVNTIDRYLGAYEGWRDQLKNIAEVKFNHTGVGTRDSPLDLDAAFLDDIRNAQRSIVIENPYIVLIPEHFQALQDAMARGVKIKVFTNSKYSTDNALVSAAWEDSRDFFARGGADVFEHPGVGKGGFLRRSKAVLKRLMTKKADRLGSSRAFLHAKTAVIDDEISYVMSYNLDPRSKNLNREVSLRVKDKPFARELRRSIEHDARRMKYLHVAGGGFLFHDAPTCGQLLRMFSRMRQVHEQL